MNHLVSEARHHLVPDDLFRRGQIVFQHDCRDQIVKMAETMSDIATETMSYIVWPRA
ncbi:hypothetical protein LGH82_31355 [Mesorhizobium sp. PAMC28654]|uniref:hypothetical protein n=1 Tax=Mesorhizobium sp. PAMC28654 TaxID=2880934 RepID=UPI001D09F600|nr:hypothetical protein [Mesorhizobium sp. PAMC28654]UDL89499.1 hypothetical protein LGH82_31355 [Mesorhizobium sp. PAMC28654]